MAEQRARWGSRLGFVLAAAGSAIGLGNIWKFPYITGENGGGAFVLVYLACIAFVGLPILMAEALLGRLTGQSPVGAMRKVSGAKSGWISVGWLNVAGAFVILSYYSVVAGWCLQYVVWSLDGSIGHGTTEAVTSLFGTLHGSAARNLVGHFVVMAMTLGVVLGGVKSGLERAATVLMPVLFVIFLLLFGYATSLDGFASAFDFVLGFNMDKLTPKGVLEALGHCFFSLSVGMGAMLTYGSYLPAREDLPKSALTIGVIDTAVAMCACLVLFPITFTFGMAPAAGPGLVFKNIPLAFSQLPGGAAWSSIFFVLLFFAAFTSAISLFEVVTATLIDEAGWTRRKSALVAGAALVTAGIPSALSGGGGLFGATMADATGRSWFDWFDYVASNWMLPLSGLGIALVAAWKVGGEARQAAFATGSTLGALGRVYASWLVLLRYVVPVGIGAIFLHAIGVL